jgi:oligopeptide/dipeptide ABC transporter ATP-binding protein
VTSSVTAQPKTTDAAADVPLLEVCDLKVWFERRRGSLRRSGTWVRAVDGVSFTLNRGETLGLVGESGSGKTTTGRAVVAAQPVTGGTIRFNGIDLTQLKGAALRRLRRHFQMVFQDPFASLDPRQPIGDILAEPLAVQGAAKGAARAARVRDLLDLVGLPLSAATRFPHQFSGGQLQRIGIARALAVTPDLIVCDEPVSALDVSIQAQIVNLLMALQARLGVAYLFIAHDLAVVRHIANRVAVMYLGRIAEIAETDELFVRPSHPYTIALLSAVPVPDAEIERRRKRIILAGDVPSPSAPPSGCRFSTRCWLRDRLGRPKRCEVDEPVLRPVAGLAAGHDVACHFAETGPAASDHR